MLKSFVYLFLLLSSVCFSYSPEVDSNLNKAWELSQKNEWRDSLDFLTSLVDNPEISDVDRVHYLWRRAHVYAVFHNVLAYTHDMAALHLLMDNPECAKEAQDYYQVMK